MFRPVTAGVVLAGGRSSRMGTAKAGLEWHGSTVLRRTVGVLGRAVDGPVFVVAAADQELPPLPSGVEVLRDPHPGRGPLQGVAAGLAGLAGRAEQAFVSAVDLPLLHPAFVRAVLAALAPPGRDRADGPPDVALPVLHGHHQPLAAAYRAAVATTASTLLDGGERRLSRLFDHCAVRHLHAVDLLGDPDLASGDPELDSVVGTNDPAAYRAARARPAPLVRVHRGDRPARTLRAATLGGAARAVGASVHGATVGGAPNGDDPHFPLVTGDDVVLM